ncbi:MAG TPA: monofunctional biosynthetic peptidoglycan transglycosylase [Rhizomicrobium sp.]|nr:monofunctional biosynthetic peptidoglycan transglycosylase [Rhizomicrobium sp.]
MAGRIKRSGWLGRIFLGLFLVLVIAPASLLLIFRALPVPGTPQMLFSLISGHGAHYAWRERLPSILARTVIGSEDQNFCVHHGFDWEEIDKALAEHARGRRLRGASTISQQTARTLFLTYQGGWVRKGFETYLTVMVEALWTKKRILEAYLNLVDWGHGNFGAEAAARAYFHKGAAQLTRAEAARLAAILPDPDKWNAGEPGPYVAERSRYLMGQAGVVARDGLDSCIK